MFRVQAIMAVPSALWESAGDELRDSFEKDCKDSIGDGV